MTTNHFDLIIIGGGAGAFAAAIRANELKAKTALINAGLPIGGTCVNVGCVPSKILLRAAELAHQARQNGNSRRQSKISDLDFQKIIAGELQLVRKMRREKYKKVLNGLERVTSIKGWAKFTGRNEIEVNGRKLTAAKFIIATGSSVTVPPIEGLKEAGFLTHIEALKLKKRPRRLIIIGGGPVGLEFAQMYRRFGTEVTILQKGPTIFPHSEKELLTRLTEILTAEGIKIETGVKIKKVKKENNRKVVEYEVGGKTRKVRAEAVLLAAGKTPNTERLNLKKAGVELDQRKAVKVNSFFQTANKNIFAVGDVINAPMRLETTAGREGSLAAENALTGSRLSVDYQAVPYTIFTDPQLSGVGWTEEEQMEKTGACACRTVSFDKVPKAIILNRTEGLIKMVIDPKTRRILGVHILAPNAGDLIAQAMVLIKNKNTIDDVINSLPVFPTLAEAIKIAALSFNKDLSQLSCCI